MRVEARRALGALLVAAVLMVALALGAGAGERSAPAVAAPLALDLQTRLEQVELAHVDGRLGVVVAGERGPRFVSADAYIAALQSAQEQHRQSALLYATFNITSPWGIAWVAVGLLGQALFTFRMLLQWWASEKHKRSIVPVGFWWGSLFGGLLLFAYFIWRKDIVGIVGQSTGVFVYARNLFLIYGRPSGTREPLAPLPHSSEQNV